jgi:hypothetical protein
MQRQDMLQTQTLVEIHKLQMWSLFQVQALVGEEYVAGILLQMQKHIVEAQSPHGHDVAQRQNPPQMRSLLQR